VRSRCSSEIPPNVLAADKVIKLLGARSRRKTRGTMKKEIVGVCAVLCRNVKPKRKSRIRKGKK